jgi:maleylpyruvate isomerase
VRPPDIGVSDLEVLTRRIEWMRAGTVVLATALSSLEASDSSAPSLLTGWTRAHVLAHVDQNAAALLNLITWAQTGVPKPMYGSLSERNEGIEAGARLPIEVLAEQVRTSAAALDGAVADLPPDRWSYPVKSALGRDLAVSEVPWLRTREVWIHSVDLAMGVWFDSIPVDLARAMIDDVSMTIGAKLAPPDFVSGFSVVLTDDPEAVITLGREPDHVVSGGTADVLAWLTGRGRSSALTHIPDHPPTLPSWI